MKVKCCVCGTVFSAKHARATYCSATCRSRAARARKAADASRTPASDSIRPPSPAEHDLVQAVRLELEAANADDSFAGQLALQLARKLVDPGESGATALSKELRDVMASALAARGPSGAAGSPALPEDDVSRAREARERKAREAASVDDTDHR